MPSSDPRSTDDVTLEPARERPASVPSGDDVTLRPDALASSSSSTLRGRLVGRFVLLERLGRGGMGVVYLAYDPELDRRIAVKLVSGGAADEGATARLLREAQALAQLAHPNIVAVHEVGRTDDGIYVAMEYVEGVTFGAWMRERPRSWQAIVAVFAAAARGIAAAHDAGLVHRDIKPDNLMVASDGRVRVLDFGLARAIGPRSGPASGDASPSGVHPSASFDVELTVPGSIMGTPVYMAPEQYAGEPVDARADVYSLCVALWEAVHGRRPFRGDSIAELADNVLTGRIADPPEGPVPQWLQAVLRRGLARAPADRFASMHELLAELERDRRRRHRQIGAIAALVAAIGLGAAVTQRLGSAGASCDAFESTLDGVWNQAMRDAIATAFVAEGKGYAVETQREVERTLDDYAGRLVAARTDACEATRVDGTQSDEVMGRRMACLDRRARHLGALTGALAAGGLQRLEHAVEAVHALPAIEACSDVDRLLREAPLPEDPELRAEVEAVRAEIAELTALASAAAFDGLDDPLAAIVERARATGHPPVLAEALLLLGRWESMRGHGDAAADALEQALAQAELGGHDEVVAQASIDLVIVEGRLRGRFDAADVHARHAAAVLARMGDPPELRMYLLSYVGQLETMRKRYDRALVALEEALALARNMGRQDDPSTSLLRSATAIALTEAGRVSEAEAMIDGTLEILEAHMGPRHPDVAVALSSRARLLRVQQRDEESIAVWQRARTIFVDAFGPDHSNVAAALNGEGLGLVALGRDEEAERAFTQSLTITERTLGRDHLHVASALANLAAAQTRRGHAQDAVANLRRVVEIRTARLGASSAMTASAEDLLGDALLAASDLAGAEAAYTRAIATFESVGGRDDARTAYGRAGLGRIAARRGDMRAAIAHLERAVALQSVDAPAHERGEIDLALAEVLEARDPVRAGWLRDQARAAFRAAGPRGARRLAELER